MDWVAVSLAFIRSALEYKGKSLVVNIGYVQYTPYDDWGHVAYGPISAILWGLYKNYSTIGLDWNYNCRECTNSKTYRLILPFAQNQVGYLYMTKTDEADDSKYEKVEIIKNKKVARFLDVFFALSLAYLLVGWPLVWYFSGLPFSGPMVYPWWMILGLINVPILPFAGVWFECRYASPGFKKITDKGVRVLVTAVLIIGVSFQIAGFL